VAAVGLCCFAAHLSLLPFHGDGDGFMTPEFRRRLRYSPSPSRPSYAAPDPLPDWLEGEALGLWPAIHELVGTMHEVNIGLRATHPFSSTWDQWPLVQCRQVLYWSVSRAGFGAWVYCVANPAVWFAVAFLAVGAWPLLAAWGVGGWLRRHLRPPALRVPGGSAGESGKGREGQEGRPGLARLVGEEARRHFWPGLTLWAGWAGNWAPFWLIPRATWHYHYLPALLVGILLVALVAHVTLEASRRHSAGAYLAVRGLWWALWVAVGGTFLFLSPWTYALPLSEEQLERRFLFQSWHM
jgi:dolichyl-phosphate-mannose--protein O-mannosyl transferase